MNREMERDDSIPDAILKQLANAIFFLLLENNTKASMDHSNTHTRACAHTQAVFTVLTWHYIVQEPLSCICFYSN